ncbi:MAG: cyclophilin-like fold protein, partial [Brachymonas sp.]
TLCQAAPEGGGAAGGRTAIVMRGEGQEVRGWLDDSLTARDFIRTLPRSIEMKRWGGREFYGKTGDRLRVAGPTQRGFADGDITYWVPGGSFAIFYDSRQDQDIDNLLVFGKVSAGLEWFTRFDDAVELRIELAEGPPR